MRTDAGERRKIEPSDRQALLYRERRLCEAGVPVQRVGQGVRGGLTDGICVLNKDSMHVVCVPRR